MAKLKLLSPSALDKKYVNSSSGEITLPDEEDLWLPSRSLALNWQLGGGIPYGKMMELFGFESTGKSLLALDFCYAAQALGGRVLWGDAEFAWTPHWIRQNGVDPSLAEVLTSNTVEEYSDWHRDQIIYWRSKLTNNEPIVVVCDSIAALDCEENIGADAMGSKSQMGNRAKAIYRMYRERSFFYKEYGVVVIMVNQVRDKVGASIYEASDITPGGKATRFYASQRVGLIRSKQIKGKMVDGKFKDDKKGKKMGQNIYLTIPKNKVAPPKENIKTQVYFRDDIYGYVGFSRYHGLPEILQELGVVTKGGSHYKYKGKSIANGEDDFLRKLIENKKMRKALIKKSGINTISKTQEKIDALTRNLYPVNVGKTQSDDE